MSVLLPGRRERGGAYLATSASASASILAAHASGSSTIHSTM
ncbi:hypothetical protein OIE13_30245 [Streptosporangium sp. NBC_01810]|nr:hypothetical protein [Streptosporangium sp. NBC_01810]WSA25169.1 hypothetical protein OIE13_30245 [Streptosporangium sp. NBC_01810]